MRILILNNGTSHLPDLRDVFKDHDLEVIKMEDASPGMDKRFDAVVLSGGSKFEVAQHPKMFCDEIQLLKNSTRPILGICLGFQLIGFAYGCRVVKNKKNRSGKVKITKLHDDPLLEGLKETFWAYQNHHWSIKCNADPSIIIALARSKDGLEAFRIKDRLIWATQFHPEGYKGNDGKRVIDNFLRVVEQHKNGKNDF